MSKASRAISFRVSSLLLVVLVVVAGGCSTIDEGPDAITELAGQLPADLPSIRGERNCELFDVGLIDGKIVFNVWNNAGQGHECPDDWLAGIDRNQYYVDGPRWRPLDHVLNIDEDGSLVFDRSGAGDGSAVVREIPEGSGFTMFRAATVELGPANRVSSRFDGPDSIETIDDITPELRRNLLDVVEPDPESGYTVTTVERAIKTLMVFRSGNPVYTLSDGECSYAMKYYTSAFDPTLTNEAAIAGLAGRFERLPDGYTFSVQTFDQDQYILDLDGQQDVMTDEFGNSYDLLSCSDNER